MQLRSEPSRAHLGFTSLLCPAVILEEVGTEKKKKEKVPNICSVFKKC